MGGLSSKAAEERQRLEREKLAKQRKEAERLAHLSYLQRLEYERVVAENLARRKKAQEQELLRQKKERENEIKQEILRQEREEALRQQQQRAREQERLRQEREEALREQQQRAREQERLRQIQLEKERAILKYQRIYGGCKPGLCKAILMNIGEYEGTYSDITLEHCDPDSSDFQNVSSIFKQTSQKHYKVIEIEKIFNPYLKACYLLREAEYHARLCCLANVEEKLMFHGTRDEYAESIWNGNFNWRLHGTAKGNIFGKGASFTPISNYASNYCDDGVKTRVMFGVHVLIGLRCIGNRFMTFPPVCEDSPDVHYDTSQKKDGHVVVKYMDDDFYPSYLIHFTGYSIKK